MEEKLEIPEKGILFVNNIFRQIHPHIYTYSNIHIFKFLRIPLSIAPTKKIPTKSDKIVWNFMQ